MCDTGLWHEPPCNTSDGPVWFPERGEEATEPEGEDVGELRAELEQLRASLRMRPDDEGIKGVIAIVDNQLRAARAAKGEN
jgi:hypothetical protein